jgi:hypothetical protein
VRRFVQCRAVETPTVRQIFVVDGIERTRERGQGGAVAAGRGHHALGS